MEKSRCKLVLHLVVPRQEETVTAPGDGVYRDGDLHVLMINGYGVYTPFFSPSDSALPQIISRSGERLRCCDAFWKCRFLPPHATRVDSIFAPTQIIACPLTSGRIRGWIRYSTPIWRTVQRLRVFGSDAMDCLRRCDWRIPLDLECHCWISGVVHRGHWFKYMDETEGDIAKWECIKFLNSSSFWLVPEDWV